MAIRQTDFSALRSTLAQDWRMRFVQDIGQRLDLAHADLSRIATILEDAGADVWTESPSDPDRLTAGRPSYSLEGWRAHFKVEVRRLSAFNRDFGANLSTRDATAKATLDEYLATMPAIAQAFNAVIANYVDAQGRVVQSLVGQAHRNTLAAAIRAQLG